MARLPSAEEAVAAVEAVVSGFSTVNTHAILRGVRGVIYAATPTLAEQYRRTKKLEVPPEVARGAAWRVERAEELAGVLRALAEGEASAEVRRVAAAQAQLREVHRGGAAERAWRAVLGAALQRRPARVTRAGGAGGNKRGEAGDTVRDSSEATRAREEVHVADFSSRLFAAGGEFWWDCYGSSRRRTRTAPPCRHPGRCSRSGLVGGSSDGPRRGSRSGGDAHRSCNIVQQPQVVVIEEDEGGRQQCGWCVRGGTQQRRWRLPPAAAQRQQQAPVGWKATTTTSGPAVESSPNFDFFLLY